MQTVDAKKVVVNIDCADLHAFDRQLYEWLVAYPAEVLPILDAVLSQAAEQLTGATNLSLQARPCDCC